jgi:hypothetical protein
MVAEEVQKLKEGDTLYWALGKKFIKGKFVRHSGNVVDFKVLCVKDDNGVEDEILHVFLVDEEAYIRETQKTFKPSFVKNKIEKKEEVNDESDLIETENIAPIQKIEKIEIKQNDINKAVKKVTKNIVSNDEMKPTLKSLDMLLKKEGCSIERDSVKWVKYHLSLSTGEHLEIIYKGKVWELYNIYVESGLQGLIDLTTK